MCALAENKSFQKQKWHTQSGYVWRVALFCNNLFYRLLALKIFVEHVVGRKESDGKITRSVVPTKLSALVIDNVINKNKDSAAGLWHTTQVSALFCSALYFWESTCRFVCQNLDLKSKLNSVCVLELFRINGCRPDQPWACVVPSRRESWETIFLSLKKALVYN